MSYLEAMRIPSLALLALAAVASPATAEDPMRRGCTGAEVARDSLAHPETRRGRMDEQICLGLDRGADGRRIELFGGTVDDGARERALPDPAANRNRDGVGRSGTDGYLGLRLRVPY